MKFPNWVKIVWWIIITFCIGFVFSRRIPSIIAGDSITLDVFLFLVLTALLLVPIFQEISFLGFTFKQGVEELKQHFNSQMAVFKAEVQTTFLNSNYINVSIPASPSDDQLPDLEERVSAAVSEASNSEGIVLPDQRPPLQGRLESDEDTLFLFKVRNTMEKKLRNIASSLAIMPDNRRPLPIRSITDILVQREVIHPKLMYAIKEIYAVCSPAIHGEAVSEAQVSFVAYTAKEVIDVLTEVEKNYVNPIKS